MPARILLASSNPGKLREYAELAASSPIELDLLPRFARLAPFEESAPTFAENAAGKALYYSKFTKEIVLADDSGLTVEALSGAPGVHSARYAGPQATDSDRIGKLLVAMQETEVKDRGARFVCVVAIAQAGRAIAVVSDFAAGAIVREPRGRNGFGYDPIFLSTELGRTYAELPPEQKNRLSHRAKAFRKLLAFLSGQDFGG